MGFNIKSTQGGEAAKEENKNAVKGRFNINKEVQNEKNKAVVADILGLSGNTNSVHNYFIDDTVNKTLDIIRNDYKMKNTKSINTKTSKKEALTTEKNLNEIFERQKATVAKTSLKEKLEKRGYFEPDYQKTYDDTVKQMKKDLREQLKEEYPKFLYYDEKTLTNFVVQSCWSEAELSKEYELLDAKFVCEYDPTAVILYGSEDFYKKMNFFEKLRCNRDDLNIDNWTEAEIETELRENAEKVEYNDIIYYKLIKQVSANESEETDDTAELTCLFCVKNGCGYTFQYGQNENTDTAAYNDFEAMLETVEYPNVYADENISLNPSEIIFSVIFSICLLLSIFTVINKKCKKGSTKMTVNKKENYKQIRESKYAQAANEHLGMSWFKFTINFRLIFGIIQYIMNFTKSYQNNTDDISLIIITEIIYTCFTFINIYVRQALANFRRNAVKLYFLLMYGFPALLNVLTVLITEEASSLVTIIGLLLLLIPELIYYKKLAFI